jgi:hypothetical protein
MYVSEEPVDPYLTYRLIYPGYYNWSHITIMQRSLEGFSEEALVDNKILDMNCVNCHSFNQYNPEKFMIHIRGSRGGTYLLTAALLPEEILKLNPCQAEQPIRPGILAVSS